METSNFNFILPRASVGAVMSQCISAWFRKCYFICKYRALTKKERKYSTTQKEMLALVWAVGQFCPYLLGRPFTMQTDHSALQWLYSFKEPEGQVARWLNFDRAALITPISINSQWVGPGLQVRDRPSWKSVRPCMSTWQVGLAFGNPGQHCHPRTQRITIPTAKCD